ncbi:MAG TPA: hypothetical protein PK340_04580 [Bacilli bacterium]|nr:hypothetical protein [Bacilli bacterium]
MERHLIKIDIDIAPTPLYDYVRRFVLRGIDEIVNDDPHVESMMKHQSFCYDIYQAINEFYIDDWQLSDIALDESEYEIKAVVLTRKSPTQGCFYKIAVTAERPHRLIDVGSFGKGALFKRYSAHKYEVATISRIYTHRLRYMDNSYRPTRFLPLTRLIDEADQVNFLVNHPSIFLKLYGPKSLFSYVKNSLDKSKLAYESIKARLLTLNPSRENEYGQQLASLDYHEWFIESIGVTPALDIDYIMMAHASDLDLRMLLNRDLKVVDIFNDQLVYPDLATLKDPKFYQAVATHYRKLLLVKFPQASVSCTQTIADANPETEATDPFAAFRGYFTTGKILIVGQSLLDIQDMEKVAYELGLPKGIIDYSNGGYDKLKGTSLSHIKTNPGRFLGIVLGPMPHKIKDLGDYASLSSKLRSEPGFPFTVEATPLTIGKNLKITKTSLKSALFKIMCHHLDRVEDAVFA